MGIDINHGAALVEKLSMLGIEAKQKAGELLVRDTDGELSPELKEQLKRYRQDVIAELILAEVENPEPTALSNTEFTRRLEMLQYAYRSGLLTEDMRDRGVDYLLGHWDNSIVEHEI